MLDTNVVHLHSKKIPYESSWSGNQFCFTEELRLPQLRLFVERDIFLAVKNGLLPKIFYEVKAATSNGRDVLRVFIRGMGTESNTNQRIIKKMESILWAYNGHHSEHGASSMKLRFIPQIILCQRGQFEKTY